MGFRCFSKFDIEMVGMSNLNWCGVWGCGLHTCTDIFPDFFFSLLKTRMPPLHLRVFAWGAFSVFQPYVSVSFQGLGPRISWCGVGNDNIFSLNQNVRLTYLFLWGAMRIKWYPYTKKFFWCKKVPRKLLVQQFDMQFLRDNLIKSNSSKINVVCVG